MRNIILIVIFLLLFVTSIVNAQNPTPADAGTLPVRTALPTPTETIPPTVITYSCPPPTVESNHTEIDWADYQTAFSPGEVLVFSLPWDGPEAQWVLDRWEMNDGQIDVSITKDYSELVYRLKVTMPDDCQLTDKAIYVENS